MLENCMPLFPTQTKQSQSFSLHEYPKAKLPLPPLWSPQEKKKKNPIKITGLSHLLSGQKFVFLTVFHCIYQFCPWP